MAGLTFAENYIDTLIKAYPRYARDQLRIMNNCIEQYGKDELENALNYCVERDLVSANNFRDTLEFFRVDEPKVIQKQFTLPEKYQMVKPKVRSVESYMISAKGGKNI